jgi:hypothetical protein
LDDPKAAEKIELVAQEWSMGRTEYQDSLRRLRARL